MICLFFLLSTKSYLSENDLFVVNCKWLILWHYKIDDGASNFDQQQQRLEIVEIKLKISLKIRHFPLKIGKTIAELKIEWNGNHFILIEVIFWSPNVSLLQKVIDFRGSNSN